MLRACASSRDYGKSIEKNLILLEEGIHRYVIE